MFGTVLLLVVFNVFTLQLQLLITIIKHIIIVVVHFGKLLNLLPNKSMNCEKKEKEKEQL